MSGNIGIGDMYNQLTNSNSNGIQGYHVEKKYFDHLEQIKQR